MISAEAGRQSTRSALFIVLTDNPGGAERIACGLAGELAGRPGWDIEVMVVCSALPGSFTREALPPSVRLRYGPARNAYFSFPLLPFRLALRRYDLVFTTHIYTNALLSLMRKAGLIRVGRLVLRESMSLFDRFSGLKARLFRALYRCYGGEDLLIAQTHYMADHVRARLSRRSSARLRTLPNPVDAGMIERARAEPLEPALHERLCDKRNILFCGRFVEFKRPALALEVFKILKTEGQEAQLVFLGSGPLEPATRRQAVELELGEDVLFLGQRTNPYPVMAACQFGLVTSANEGFPNVILEMMACRLNGIVVTPCAGDLETLPGVAVTQTHEAGEIAAALRSLMHSQKDFGALFREVAASRSTKVYMDAVLAP